MNRKALSVVIGALALATAVVGYQLYQEEHKTDDIEIGKRGFAAERK